LLYRTENGVYSDDKTVTVKDGKIAAAGAFDLSKYQMSGGAVYFSVQGSTTISDEKADVTGVTGAKAIVLPQRRSKEVKVTIAKLANAPKAVADYKNNTISIPKGAGYRIIKDRTTTLPDMGASVSDSKAVKVSVDRNAEADSADTYGKTIKADVAFSLDVQTLKTDTKPASKVGHYIFAAQEETPSSLTKSDEKSNKAGGIDFTLANADKDNAYKVTYYAVGKESGKASTKTVAKGATAVKFSKVSTLAGVSITVQRIGDKKTLTWTTAAANLDGSAANNGANVNALGKITYEGNKSLVVTVNGSNYTLGEATIKKGDTRRLFSTLT
jgi:hypothetical protein